MHRNILPSFRCVIREGVKGCNHSFAAMKKLYTESTLQEHGNDDGL